MSRAGPTFVKLSQWAASRTDIFSTQLCIELGKLHDSNRAHPATYSKRAIARAFSVQNMEQVFESFDERPLGAGAVAQVHKAVLKDADSEVAIKVLHPGVAEQIHRDLKIMKWGACIIGSCVPGMKWLSLPDEVRLFGQMMESQVDLRIESQNMQQFAKNFGHYPPGTVTFPLAILPLSNSNDVLVESYRDGVPLRAFLNASSLQADRHTVYDRELGGMGLHAFLHMLIYDNFVHADLHPGNIMVDLHPPYLATPLDKFVEDFYDMSPFTRRQRQQEPPLPTAQQAHQQLRQILGDYDQGTISQQEMASQIHQYTRFLYRNGYTASLVFLDCGLVTALADNGRRNFIDLFEAVCTFDGRRAGQLMINRCQTPHLVVAPDVFVLRIQDIILKVRQMSFQLSKLTFSEIFNPVMSAVRIHHVRLAPEFINIIMAMFVLEGIGRRLDPDSDILKVALPMLRKWLRDEAKHELNWNKQSVSEGVRASSWQLYKVWLYVEFREYVERIRDWGADDGQFFGPFAPFITADSSLS